MADRGGLYGQVWEGDYGTREGFLAAIDRVNQEVDEDAIVGLSIFWSDIPYELQLYCYVAYDPDHSDTEPARQLVSEMFMSGGGRLRSDITSTDLTQAISQRQLNSVGCIKGVPVHDPCHFDTKAGLAAKGFDFSSWRNRSRTFLSHQADRKSQVSTLQMLLTDWNVPTWMDLYDIEFGEPIANAIERGRSESTFVIFWISEGFLKSRWCQFEFEGFLHDYASSRSVVLLPVVESGCETKLPPLLKRIKYFSVDAPGDPQAVARALGPQLSGTPRPNMDVWQ